MEYRLPKEFATKWIEALRGGDYKQGRNKLFDGEGYCCLGVCLASKGVKGVAMGSNQYLGKGMWSFSGDIIETIPNELMGTKGDNDLVYHLTTLNDEGSSFNDIADWIEQNVELY